MNKIIFASINTKYCKHHDSYIHVQDHKGRFIDKGILNENLKQVEKQLGLDHLHVVVLRVRSNLYVIKVFLYTHNFYAVSH